MDYDYIIVGGGSAGSVLANRLSARSANKVLVCEAGPDTPPGREPAVILDSYPGTAYLDNRFHWTELKVTTEVISHNRPDGERPPLRKYEQARVLGGGSSINGQMANRGAPGDYDEWGARGAAGWSWETVLPYFKKVERDLDFDDPAWHGTDGRIPVRRIMPPHWTQHAKAVGEALAADGFAFLPDQNGAFVDGYFPVTISNAEEKRVSAATGYLDAATRQRGNLTISTETAVAELLFDGARCVGVQAMVQGRPQEFRGREVILCAGAIHSPAHLLRAGIGPALALRELGIEVRANRAGVGQRLMDHPSIALASFVKPHARLREHTRRHIHVGLRYSSGLDGAPQGDMFVAVASKSSWHAVGEQIGSFILFVNKTYSESGQVRLASRDWRAHPAVEFNLLSDRRDVARLMAGFRRLARVHEHPAMRAVMSHPFPASWGDKVRQVALVNAKNKWLTGVMAALMDGPAPLRDYLIDRFILDGEPIDVLLRDEAALEAFVRKAAVGVWHASCSCRMGADDDPMAVTDSAGRVRDVAGLRVVDASIFPVVPRANTNFPTLMTAEKIADDMLEGR